MEERLGNTALDQCFPYKFAADTFQFPETWQIPKPIKFIYSKIPLILHL
jgi:hypothetical protein